MIIGFVIWSVVCVTILGVGIWTWRSKEAAGFFTGVKPPEVDDIRAYNHSVAILWFVYAAVFECLGLPFLAGKQNGAGFIWAILGVVAITIMLPIVYTRILAKHRIREK